MVVHGQELVEDVEAFLRGYVENVNLDEEFDEGSSLVRRNLQGIDSQRKEYFRESVLGFRLLVKSLIEFGLVIPQNLLRDQIVLLVLIMF